MNRLRAWLAGAAFVATAGAVALVPTVHAAAPETANPGDTARLEHEHVDVPLAGHAPTGRPAPVAAAVASGNGIDFHGGAVMTNPVHNYVIWYGNWSGNTATTILPNLLSSIGASPWYKINTTYTDAAGTPVSTNVTLAAQTTDAYSQGSRNLSDTAIRTIVSRAISSGRLPADADGMYFVLTSPDVTKTGFLTQYCGWHTYSTISNKIIKYSFVGNPGSNPACNIQTTTSPNANPGADAMASVIAHELVEAVSDPQLNAWYDSKGYENADKCAWTFGTTFVTSNGSKANMTLGGKNYLVQQNWVNAGGGRCSLTYP